MVLLFFLPRSQVQNISADEERSEMRFDVFAIMIYNFKNADWSFQNRFDFSGGLK